MCRDRVVSHRGLLLLAFTGAVLLLTGCQGSDSTDDNSEQPFVARAGSEVTMCLEENVSEDIWPSLELAMLLWNDFETFQESNTLHNDHFIMRTTQVLLHELGHILGLQHDEESSILHHTVPHHFYLDETDIAYLLSNTVRFQWSMYTCDHIERHNACDVYIAMGQVEKSKYAAQVFGRTIVLDENDFWYFPTWEELTRNVQ